MIALLLVHSVFGQEVRSPDKTEKTLTIDEAADSDVFAFGKNVIIKRSAKGVLAFGGDVIVEGNVSGDVATIGGSVIQRENAFIGGDVIIFGGTYRSEGGEPRRNPGHETVMYAGYEEELRSLTQNPTQIFAPSFTWSFFVQRLLSVLFWFIVAFLLSMIAPGAVGRAVKSLRLSPLHVFGMGMSALIVATLAVIASLKFLPNPIGIFVAAMTFILLSLAYVFGRTAFIVTFGKLLQANFLSAQSRSEATAILLGSIALTVILSVPYVWALVVVLLFAASLGLVLSAPKPARGSVTEGI
jgi:hypothetical protein